MAEGIRNRRGKALKAHLQLRWGNDTASCKKHRPACRRMNLCFLRRIGKTDNTLICSFLNNKKDFRIHWQKSS